MTETRAFGIDVSRYDGLLNWGAVEAHDPQVHFIAMRSTISWGYKDPFFKANWQAGRGKVLRSAYHVIYPGEDAVRQYDNIMSALDGDIGELPITIDAELDHGLPKSTITRTTRKLAELIIMATHRRPFLYSRANWIDEHLYFGDVQDLPLWLATYLRVPFLAQFAREHLGPPILPRGASTYAIHQTGDHLPPFCSTTTKAYQDYDRWNGTADSLYKFAGINVLEPPIEQPQNPPETILTGALRFKALRPVNIRKSPTTASSDVGDIAAGQILTALNVGGDSSWVQIGPDKWVAVKHNGTEYLRKVD